MLISKYTSVIICIVVIVISSYLLIDLSNRMYVLTYKEYEIYNQSVDTNRLLINYSFLLVKTNNYKDDINYFISSLNYKYDYYLIRGNKD